MQRLSLIPQPQHITAPGGDVDLASLAGIAADPGLEDLAWLLSDLLARGTGTRLAVADAWDTPALCLKLEGERPADLTIDSEAYRLTADVHGVELVAAHPAGISRAIATLRQLLPADALRDAPSAAAIIPRVHIEDAPRLRWRGVMLDIVRNFQAKDFVLRMIDRAHLHRLNVLHLHLTDDQGWRFEVPSRPALTEVASWRPETVIGHARAGDGYDGTPHGGFYSAADLREIVAYAAARHILVVPEVNFPGHARAILAAYPELGAGQNRPVSGTFGVFEEVLEPTEAALAFARDVFDVVAEVFDSPFVHIGGDEVPTTQWESSQTVKDLMEREGITSYRGVQGWFTKACVAHLTSLGKRVIGWDEILDGGEDQDGNSLDGGAPPEAVVQVWRNEAYVKQAVAAGHDVIVSPEPYVYFDHYEGDGEEEPLRIHGQTTIAKVAAWDPVPAGVDPERVLGAQCQLWSEYMPTARDVEYGAFPRLAVFADVAWSGQGVREAEPVTERLEGHLERLDALGINYRPLEGPKPWQRGGTGRRARFTWKFIEHPAE
ncbi:beta-N-acetylhexosaminidase [Glycomyces buryatensis]|uniref:beta-N-acetylhexosaminidase n=1 Tax=Glycomyces buryatensis TaxID=2570927 RepID=A0A4S8Q912_9ACTN|nr:beta-N-acetylhexosaminidase [Glycomyces buryatensis]THV40913.1 beta-N-acetylhexosaminidase [Glycomyces buryatensis]